jgi:hypothetical protein
METTTICIGKPGRVRGDGACRGTPLAWPQQQMDANAYPPLLALHAAARAALKRKWRGWNYRHQSRKVTV